MPVRATMFRRMSLQSRRLTPLRERKGQRCPLWGGEFSSAVFCLGPRAANVVAFRKRRLHACPNTQMTDRPNDCQRVSIRSQSIVPFGVDRFGTMVCSALVSRRRLLHTSGQRARATEEPQALISRTAVCSCSEPSALDTRITPSPGGPRTLIVAALIRSFAPPQSTCSHQSRTAFAWRTWNLIPSGYMAFLTVQYRRTFSSRDTICTE